MDDLFFQQINANHESPFLGSEKYRFQASERGGIVIMACFMIIVFLSLTVFTLSRNVIRETAITGSVIQAGRSESAADAGIDWYLTWAQPNAKGAGQMAAKMKEDFAKQVSSMDVRFPSIKYESSLKDDMALEKPEGKTVDQAFDLELSVVDITSESGVGNPSGFKNVGDVQKTVSWELNSKGRSIVSKGETVNWEFFSERAARFKLRFEE